MSVPFAARIVTSNAREILARDRARAQKLLAGLHPHGPAAFHKQELRKRHPHHHKKHHASGTGDASGTTGSGGATTGSGAAGSTPDGGDSIDVTDAG